MADKKLKPEDRLKQQYGDDFPGSDNKDGKAWRKWIDSQRAKQASVMRDKRLHWSRHRHFRIGQQWISTRDGRTWREPNTDSNDLRPVLNIVGPSLDFRLGVLVEQRPGFRHEPIGSGVAGREAAEAQQAVAEYYFYLLRAWNIFLDALYHSQTDGAAFVHVFVDKAAGPRKLDVTLVAPDNEQFAALQEAGHTARPDGLLTVPNDEDGEFADPGTEPTEFAQGDIASRVVLAHEVTFDPEARTVNGPQDRAKWAMIRRLRDVESARIETGKADIEAESNITAANNDAMDQPLDRIYNWQRSLPPYPTRRQHIKDGVPEYLVFIAPNTEESGLEQGLRLRLVGNVIVEFDDELPGGVIPLARFTDGSPDADIFPRPVISDWIGDQIAINAMLSLLLKQARFFGGGRLLALKNTLLEESYSTISGSVVEYQGMKPEVLQPVAAGKDTWSLLEFLIKQLQDKTLWSDLARGAVSGSGGFQDVSGRALLAANERLERGFGPAVRAAAEGATEWSHLVVKYAQWLFDEPRLIPMVSGRGDLAKSISKDKLGDRPLVYVDPETLMPLPRALRAQQLQQLLDQGHITIDTFKERSPYADIRNVHMGAADQWQRAQFVNTLLEERWETLGTLAPEELYTPAQGIVVLWQDDTAAHKAALLEIIIDDSKPWPMRRLAQDRWGIYDQLERAKADVTATYVIPPEVLGVPLDRSVTAPPSPAPGSAQPGNEPAGPEAQAAPTLSGANALPAGATQAAAPLGEYGAVERAAVAARNEQS